MKGPRTQGTRGHEDPEVTSGAPSRTNMKARAGRWPETGPFPVPIVTHSPTTPPWGTLAPQVCAFVCVPRQCT